MNMEFSYDVVVVGAGHAGCEAAAAAARLGASTCLITMDMNKIAQMSCNPAVGGIAKGQIVREIDALGGQMGRITDRCAIQFRTLNRSKGPAMWSPRAQCDRARFITEWRQTLENTPNLSIWQDQVEEIIVENGRAVGVRTVWDVLFHAGAVVLTAGTFLNGLMHIGRSKVPGGRCAEPPSPHLTESLTRHGMTAARMKTGTPVRIDARTVDFSLLGVQDGEDDFHRFSFLSPEKKLPQLPCWSCSTNEEVHRILQEGLPESPLYNGQIKSIGPRYCPSIETKLVTFPERTQHPLFLEPEGTNTNELYLNGFSSSMPIRVQLDALHAIPALRNAQIYRPGYAIEYDFFDPTELEHSLESKKVAALFLAGQVNGTTGYEEAAGQGLIAGINAARKCSGNDALVLGRDEAYIGVLIDDLVTKGVDEPYRMFTSRAEFRILLRQDNADARLTPIGRHAGLVDNERWQRCNKKYESIEELLQFCKSCHIKPESVNFAMESLNSAPLHEGCKLSDLLQRPQLTFKNLCGIIAPLKQKIDEITESREEICEAAEISIKYQGYIERERNLADRARRLEGIRIKNKFQYENLHQITTEARQKLARINPDTLGQASRIPGVSPNDVAILMVLARKASNDVPRETKSTEQSKNQ